MKNLTIPVQDTVFDLDAFDEVTLGKEVTYATVETVDEALELMGNQSEKLLQVINDGLKAEARRVAKNDPTGWHRYIDDDTSKGLNGVFAGQPADMSKVNSLVLTLAKTVFGFHKDLSREQKGAAKENAKSMIQNTPAIREGLKKSAALGLGADGE